MGKAVIVFIFPEPEDEMSMALIIHKAKEVFEYMPEVTAHLAIQRSAELIIDYLNPIEVVEED